jgi:predicted Zn-dependent protease
LAEAEQQFKDLLVMNPASASVHAFLADTLWDQGQLTRAIASFRKAVERAPKSEMASLGLFHTLLESDDREGAIAEMDRFLSLSDSEEYQALATIHRGKEDIVDCFRGNGRCLFFRCASTLGVG